MNDTDLLIKDLLEELRASRITQPTEPNPEEIAKGFSRETIADRIKARREKEERNDDSDQGGGSSSAQKLKPKLGR